MHVSERLQQKHEQFCCKFASGWQRNVKKTLVTFHAPSEMSLVEKRPKNCKTSKIIIKTHCIQCRNTQIYIMYTIYMLKCHQIACKNRNFQCKIFEIFFRKVGSEVPVTFSPVVGNDLTSLSLETSKSKRLQNEQTQRCYC